MTISPEAERLASHRAQVQTDSLTVTVDLRRAQPWVADALRRVLQLPANPSGALMPAQDLDSFQTNAQLAFQDLERRSRLDALEFATLLSALLHECRHVHDLRGTRLGAELLLHDLRVYAGVSSLLDRLADWRHGDTGRHVPLPVSARLEHFGDQFADVSERIRSASSASARVARWWDARSTGPILPGHSIRSLFETLGYFVQVEWLAHTFGGEVADTVTKPTVEATEAVTQKYLRPLIVLASLSAARGVSLDPELHDVSWLLVHALSVSGIPDAFADGSPTGLHPGTWFDKFARQYASLSARKDVSPALLAPYAVELATGEAGIGDMQERFAKANTAIQELQDETLRELGAGLFSGGPRQLEPILIATEVAADFRAMQRAISEQPRYHLPLGYVGMLVTGELTTVHVRVNNPNGMLGDFRTPSEIPSNHVGGARVASEAAQQMRILLKGRDMAHGTFFEDAVFKRLRSPPPDGRGLSFRVVE